MKPSRTDFRVVCGGSWYYSSASHVRATFRIDFKPSVRDVIFGFRTHITVRFAR